MGALTRDHPWENTCLGPPNEWPQSLRITVRLLLNSQHPMFIWWGPNLIQFYNDAYRKTMGPERHPSALGQRGHECWEEIWDIIGPQIEFVMAGNGATWHEDQLVPVTRHGSREDVWWTYGYSPIDNGQGGVGGVLVVCNDVTEQHLAQERLRRMFEQAPGFIAVLSGTNHVFQIANDPVQETGWRPTRNWPAACRGTAGSCRTGFRRASRSGLQDRRGVWGARSSGRPQWAWGPARDTLSGFYLSAANR